MTGGDRFAKYQPNTYQQSAPLHQQPVATSQTNCQLRDSYSNTRKKETSVPKENYYYHSSSQNYNSYLNQNNGNNQSK